MNFKERVERERKIEDKMRTRSMEIMRKVAINGR